MHLTLIYFVVILLSASVYSTQQDELSDKEIARADVHYSLNRTVDLNIEHGCATNLTAEQILDGKRKVNEFYGCLRITVDKLFDRLDDDITTDELHELSGGRKIFPHMCDLFGEAFKCFEGLEPVLDLCLGSIHMLVKNNGFTLAPMIYESVCVENATFLVDFVTQPDAGRCLHLALDDTIVNDLSEQIFYTNDILGSESDCKKLSQAQTQFLDKIHSCSKSDGTWNAAKRLIGNFCGQTKCQQLVSNFKCFE